jgi:adenylate cyclase, class 2
MQNHTETEVKIPLESGSSTESRLHEKGFRVSVARTWESNELYDTEDRSLRRKGMLLRLRHSGDRSILTWKGQGSPGPHKSRPELETTLGSLPVFRVILEQLGYMRTFRYEKYRTEYSKDQENGVVTVDETPIGNFLEIEGEGKWIDATAAALGFLPKDYVLDSYGQLYLDYCQRHGLEPRDMVFASHAKEPTGV